MKPDCCLRFLMSLIAVFFLSCTAEKQGIEKNKPVDFSQVKVTDNFWQPRLMTHAIGTVPACIRQCETETRRIDNFAIAAGMQEGVFQGFFYDDSDVYKMLEGASYSLMNNPNPALEARLDSIIMKIAGVQQKDGYLNTFYTLGDFNARWTDMDKHEMYCFGHLTEAAIAFYNATGKRSLLDVAIKFADHIDATFGPDKRDWVPGHEEVELALIKLYRTTGENRYLQLSHWLLEQRGRGKGTWDDEYRDYYQDLVPVRELEKISGHAVRAMYLFTGMADYTAATGDTSYLGALNRLWDDVMNKKMYITGGIGSSQANEGFTEPYDLPNEEAYCETCASVGMVMWNQRMNMLTGESQYADILEKSMYNGALAGVSLSGDRFFYVNPLYSKGDHHRREWYGTACCPSQITRFLPSIGGYVYALSDQTLWINLYVGSRTTVNLAGTETEIIQNTLYPWEGRDEITVNPQKAVEFSLRLRIPGWCNNYSVSINGKESAYTMDKGYLVITRLWNKGDLVEFGMDMPVRTVSADPRVKANTGRRAVQRGPIIYCLEETDNPEFDRAQITSSTVFTTTFEPDLLGGVATVQATANGETLKFIPYYAWDNREAGKMEVWVEYKE